jgi:tetratricopeptide (TPR) repeat protein
MNTPIFFKLPISRFDLELLPKDARSIGSEKFKDAVVAHFVQEYVGKNLSAMVSVDDIEITVLTFPINQDPFDFVLSLLKAGRLQEAVPYLEAMDKNKPGQVQILYNLGIAYSELGQLDEAIIRLKYVVKIEPKHAHAWTAIGVAYQRLGKQDKAVEPLEMAVKADPTDGYARRNLGAVLLNKGDAEEALVHLREARKALPHDAQTTYGLAAALEEVGGEKNLSEADELYIVVIERFPASPVAEEAREARTRLSHKSMRDAVSGGIRPDVVMYIAGALDTFKKQGIVKRQQIALEIALKGQSGLDINDPTQKYTLKTLPGKFSGMHLLSIMYTAFKQIDPTMDSGVDLQAEFDAAMAMRKD